jgi:DUF971 family protein
MKTVPEHIKLDKKRNVLELSYEEQTYSLNAEFLRVLSPSAEVKGHGPNDKRTPLNKEKVVLQGLEAQGNYAIKLLFDDGHDTGIYSWDYLFDLAVNQDKHWKDYLADAELEREKHNSVQTIQWR